MHTYIAYVGENPAQVDSWEVAKISTDGWDSSTSQNITLYTVARFMNLSILVSEVSL